MLMLVQEIVCDMRLTSISQDWRDVWPLPVTPHSDMCVCILKCMFAYAECIFVCILLVVNRMDLITANTNTHAGEVIHTDLE